MLIAKFVKFNSLLIYVCSRWLKFWELTFWEVDILGVDSLTFWEEADETCYY